MSVQLLDALKEKSASLTENEKIELAEYLLKQTKQRPPQRTPREAGDETKRRVRSEWIAVNRENYGGNYVALDGDRLIGVGKTYSEAAAAAKLAGVSDAYIDYVMRPDEIGFVGDW